MQKVKIEQFLSLSRLHPVLDVRSPGEFTKAHIPGAINLPLFSEEERKLIGTQYKVQGREIAIKTGLDFFGVRMKKIVEAVEEILAQHNSRKRVNKTNTVLVHCWRGGMRSSAIAWLLDLYGFKVYALVGGYKAFRNWSLQQFDKPYNFKILGGFTGAGKTLILKELTKAKESVIDIEGLAKHKGSAFGGLGGPKQPSQEMFENCLAFELNIQAGNGPESKPIWLEDESRRIGKVNLPDGVWNTMRKAPVFFLEVPFEERLTYITEEYSKYKKDEFVNAIIRIHKRLGGLNTSIGRVSAYC